MKVLMPCFLFEFGASKNSSTDFYLKPDYSSQPLKIWCMLVVIKEAQHTETF